MLSNKDLRLLFDFITESHSDRMSINDINKFLSIDVEELTIYGDSILPIGVSGVESTQESLRRWIDHFGNELDEFFSYREFKMILRESGDVK